MIHSSTNTVLLVLGWVVAALVIANTQAFAPTPQRHSFAATTTRTTTTTTTTTSTQRNGIFDKVGEFFAELDAFVDDATSRRLGNGSKFYGKRRSNFYGEKDQDRKRDRSVADPTGEY